MKNRVENRASKKDDDHESEILLASYRNLNDFLCSFLSRLLPTHNYVVRRRYPLEKILNIEFQKTQIAGSSDSIFYKGSIEEIFTNRKKNDFVLLRRSGSKFHSLFFLWPREFFVHLEHGHFSLRRLFRFQLRSRRLYHFLVQCGKKNSTNIKFLGRTTLIRCGSVFRES